MALIGCRSGAMRSDGWSLKCSLDVVERLNSNVAALPTFRQCVLRVRFLTCDIVTLTAAVYLL